MTNRNLKFLLLVLCAIAAIGYLAGSYAAFGILAGIGISIYIYHRRYSVVDELETEIFWHINQGWKDQPEEDAVPRWSEVWRPAIFIVALGIVIAIMFLL